MPRALQVALLWIISLAWIANVVIAYFQPTLAQPIVNAPFMVVAAILFRQLRRQRSADDPEGEDQSPTELIEDARRTVGEIVAGERKPGDGS